MKQIGRIYGSPCVWIEGISQISKKQMAIALVILCLQINGCSFSSGHYGPFTMIIESTDGEPVEDIIVGLASYGGKFTFGYSERRSKIYNNDQVVTTGNKIIFPRGFITRTDERLIPLGISIDHPDYSKLPSTVILFDSTQHEGEIDLGKVVIRKNQRDKEKFFQMELGRGFTIEQAEISYKRVGLLYVARTYFVVAVRHGRSDLVDKYLPIKIAEIYPLDSVEAQEFELKIRTLIKNHTE